VVTALVAIVLGSGTAAAVRGARVAEEPEVETTSLGPVAIHLPDDAGPWRLASEEAARAIREAHAGPVEIDGVWGALGDDGVVVTVLEAAPGTHGGIEQFRPSVPEGEAEWSGHRAHAAGAAVVDGVRELVLVVEAPDGALVVLSVCGPEDAFASGSLAEAFRTARVG